MKEKTDHSDASSRLNMICGLPRRHFYGFRGILSMVLILILVLILIAVIVLVSITKSKEKSQAKISPLRNPSMAALSWEVLAGVKHHRVYYQEESNAILESAWSSNGTAWKEFVVAERR
jgi:amino acid transporter